jgi:hypothetical protein
MGILKDIFGDIVTETNPRTGKTRRRRSRWIQVEREFFSKRLAESHMHALRAEGYGVRMVTLPNGKYVLFKRK